MAKKTKKKDIAPASYLTVNLSHGPNYDLSCITYPTGYWQPFTDPPSDVRIAKNLKHAQEMFVAWQERNELGGGNMLIDTGVVRQIPGEEILGRFSYNGRFWRQDGTEEIIK